MQLILLQADIGLNLMTIDLLLSKHKTLETEFLGQESPLQFSINGRDELIQYGRFEREKIQKRSQDITDTWSHFIDLMNDKIRRLPDHVDSHRLLINTGDVDNWMLDILELVPSDDSGKDESKIQTLLNKYKEVSNELGIYQLIIDSPLEQASALREKDGEPGPAVERLSSIDGR